MRDDDIRGNFRRNVQRRSVDTPVGLSREQKILKKTRLKLKLQQTKAFRDTIDRRMSSHKRLIVGVGVGLAIAGTGLVVLRGGFGANPGDPTSDTQQGVSEDGASAALPKVTDFEFEVLTPKGKKAEELGAVLVSPPNNPPVYAYLDDLTGATIKVSQQELPDSFKSDEANKLEELAASFQAQNVIEIDGKKVYHGYSDRGGGVQSLVLIRSGLLVLISADRKLSDDTWFSYITSMNK